MITHSKFHDFFSIRIFPSGIKLNRWCIAVFKNIMNSLRITKNISSACDLRTKRTILESSMIKFKRNIVISEHLCKIGIKTSFTITMKVNGYH